MARAKRSVADRIKTLSLRYTQSQIAKMIGVSTRTVRRYKRGDTVPSKSAVVESIVKISNKEIRRLYRQGASPAAVPIPVVVRHGRKTEWINYNIDGRSLYDIFNLINRYNSGGWVCQLVSTITTGPNKGKKVGTQKVNGWLDRWGPQKIWSFINSVLWFEYSGDGLSEDKGMPNRPEICGFTRVSYKGQRV